jgi:hypothetical protein
MAALVSAPWLGVALPVVLAALLIALGRFSKPLVPWVAILAPLTVLGIGLGSVVGRTGGDAVAPWTSSLASFGGFVWFGMGAGTRSCCWSWASSR